MEKKKNQVGKAKRKDQPFAPQDLPAILDGHGTRLSEIARAIRPGDETAIEMYAEQLANEIVRTYFRDVAAGVKAAKLAAEGLLDAEDDKIQKLAEQGMPEPNAFRSLVGQIQQLIRDTIKAIGNAREST